MPKIIRVTQCRLDCPRYAQCPLPMFLSQGIPETCKLEDDPTTALQNIIKDQHLRIDRMRATIDLRIDRMRAIIDRQNAIIIALREADRG